MRFKSCPAKLAWQQRAMHNGNHGKCGIPCNGEFATYRSNWPLRVSQSLSPHFRINSYEGRGQYMRKNQTLVPAPRCSCASSAMSMRSRRTAKRPPAGQTVAYTFGG